MTSSTWSPVLKKMIGLATIDAGFSGNGAELEVEHTVDAVRHRVAREGGADAVLQSAAQDADAAVIKPGTQARRSRRRGGHGVTVWGNALHEAFPKTSSVSSAPP